MAQIRLTYDPDAGAAQISLGRTRRSVVTTPVGIEILSAERWLPPHVLGR